MNHQHAKTGATTTLAAATLTLIASFLPWATFLGLEKNGIDGDGAITAALAVLAGLLAIVMLVNPSRPAATAAFIAAIAAVAVCYIDILDVTDNDLNVGYGLWLTLLGVTGIGVGSAVHYAALTPLRD